MPGRGLFPTCMRREDCLQEKGEEGRCPRQREEQGQRYNQGTERKPEQHGLLKGQYRPGRCNRCNCTCALPVVQPTLLLQEVCSNHGALLELVEGLFNLSDLSMGHIKVSESKRGPHRDQGQGKFPLHPLEAQAKQPRAPPPGRSHSNSVGAMSTASQEFRMWSLALAALQP